MKKKAPIQKKTASAQRGKSSTAKRKPRRPEARASKLVARPRRSEVRQAPVETVGATVLPVAEIPAIVTRKPEARAPMPVELARMLEEETWWRVVPAGIPAVPVRSANLRRSASKSVRTVVQHKSSRR